MSMAEQINEYLQSQLGLIRKGNQITLFNGQAYTFRTDAGHLVTRNLGYTEYPDDSAGTWPMIDYYTQKNASSVTGDPAPELGMEMHTLEISVDGFIESDRAGTEGDDLLLDICCALKSDPHWGGLLELLDGFTAENAVQVGDVVFTLVKVGFNALYTAPFGSE